MLINFYLSLSSSNLNAATFIPFLSTLLLYLHFSFYMPLSSILSPSLLSFPFSHSQIAIFFSGYSLIGDKFRDREVHSHMHPSNETASTMHFLHILFYKHNQLYTPVAMDAAKVHTEAELRSILSAVYSIHCCMRNLTQCLGKSNESA